MHPLLGSGAGLLRWALEVGGDLGEAEWIGFVFGQGISDARGRT